MKPLLLLAALALPAALLAQPAKVKIKTKTAADGGVAPHGPVRVPPQAAADPTTAYAERYITQANLRRDLSVLASDEYEGRETGTKGQKMAAAYISQQFALDSLVAPMPVSGRAGASNPYLQTFGLERSAWQPGGTLVVGGTTYKWLTDFYAVGRSPFPAGAVVQPVFVGYGIEQATYSDYAGHDVKGKDVLMLLGEPRTADGKPALSADGAPTKWGVDYRAKAALAAQKGARSVFFVSLDAPANFERQAARLGPRLVQPTIAFADQPTSRAPAFFVSPTLGLKLLGASAAEVKEYEAAVVKAVVNPQTTVCLPPSIHLFKLGTHKTLQETKVSKFTIDAQQTRTSVSTENVLGFLPGTNKKEEILVISAHYDHLGVHDGQVFNGADDDGSGTVGVLALARAFSKAAHAGQGPRRSVLFLANTGEEKGLLGSEYYTTHPVYPLANTVADLNIDMIGRTDVAHEGKPDYVYVIGSDKLSSQLHQALLAANEQHGNLDLDFRFNDPNDPNRFYYRSDHYNFAVHKIPVAFFFNGVHADYHQASDEVDKIQFDKLEARARLVFFLAWDLANRDERPVVDSNKP